MLHLGLKVQDLLLFGRDKNHIFVYPHGQYYTYMCHDFHVLGRVATMDTATQHSKLSYQNYLLEYTKCVLRGNMLK